MIWGRNKIVINNIFLFTVATKIVKDNYDPQIINEYRQRHD